MTVPRFTRLELETIQSVVRASIEMEQDAAVDIPGYKKTAIKRRLAWGRIGRKIIKRLKKRI